MALCADCILEAGQHPLWQCADVYAEGDPNPMLASSLRWLEFGTYSIVKCTVCHTVSKYDDVSCSFNGIRYRPNYPSEEQQTKGLCHDCWRGFKNASVRPGQDSDEELARLFAQDPGLDLFVVAQAVVHHIS
jgi:hypothetical protein